MDGTLLGAFFTAVGVLVAAYFNYRSVQASTEARVLRDQLADSKEQLLAVKKELARMYRQVAAYHQLEEIVTQDALKADPKQDPRAIKKTLRDRAVGMGVERPEITRMQAERKLRELEVEI